MDVTRRRSVVWALAALAGVCASPLGAARAEDRFGGLVGRSFRSRDLDYPVLLASPKGQGPMSGMGILMLHGGGGLASDLATFVGPARRWADMGATVALPSYFSMAPNAARTDDTAWWAQAVADAAAWLETQPGVRADRLGAIGYSRGGYVAAETAVQRTNIGAVVGVASAGNVRPSDIRRSPAVMLIYASEDPVIPAARTRRWARILENKGVAVDVVGLNSRRHAFNADEWSRIFAEAESFFQTSLSPNS